MYASQLLLLLSLYTAHAALECSPASLSSLLPTDATINFAVPVPENGTFGQGVANLEFPTNATNLPALCAVGINVKSSSTSSYNLGLFLPQVWNVRTMTAGNGGLGGGINWPDMGSFTHYGFAAISTDTGHVSTAIDSTWALNKPESIIDWGYRAMHGSVVLGKQVIEAYYASGGSTNTTGKIAYNYYASCSTGGRQGLKEVQRFPEDFDGIAVGAPAWWTTHLQTWTEHLGILNLPTTSSSHIPPALFPVYVAEVTRQCDIQDGVKDSIVSDPYGCNFFPEALLCAAGANSSACFTPPQLSTLYHIFSDWVETNQTFVFPGLSLGTDPSSLADVATEPSPLGQQFMENFYLNTTQYDYTGFDFATVQFIENLDTGDATADQYDLSVYNARGGKILMYHGLGDPLIPTGSSTYYYKQVLASMGTQGVNVDDFYRLFLVPGMGHCAGSPNAPWYIGGGNQVPYVNGADYSVPGYMDAEHDVLLAMMQWTEEGVAPDLLIATKYVNDTVSLGVEKQRPLCVYPEQVKYDGVGDVNAAESWACKSLY